MIPLATILQVPVVKRQDAPSSKGESPVRLRPGTTNTTAGLILVGDRRCHDKRQPVEG